jgi:Na+/H+ antiporter NhaA
MPLRSASFGRFPRHEAVTAVLLLAAATPVDPGQQERLGCYGRALIERADPARARLATAAVNATVPADDRLQSELHPVSACLVVPVFGLANAGVHLDGDALRASLSSGATPGSWWRCCWATPWGSW